MSKITIHLVCSKKTNTFKAYEIKNILQFYLHDQDNRYYFQNFGCTFEECCEQNKFRAVMKKQETKPITGFENAIFAKNAAESTKPYYF